MQRGESRARLDPQYLGVERRKRSHYANPAFPLTQIGELATLVQYGISERANSAGLGVPIIRMNNLQANGWDLSDIKHIELGDTELKRYRLLKGDLVFNRTNSKELVGKCEAFLEEGDWVFASYLIRVRVDTGRVLPQFVSSFLNSPAGRIQIDQVSRQIAGMTNVNAEELRLLEVPLPPIELQRQLIAGLDAARAERDHALAEAERLLTSVDELVKVKLGLPDLKPPKQAGYSIRLGNAKKTNMLSADFFHPERMQAVRMIQRLNNAPLSQLVVFQRNIIKSPGESRYIGLASIAPGTGQLTDAIETASGLCFAFQPGDVLYGRLRPYLNKVWLATFPGVCSTEFHVMRPFDTRTLRPEYLSVVMRTTLIVAQTKHMMTGNTHPRIANEDVTNLLVPLVDEATQQKIVNEALACQAESLRLSNHAESVWRQARERFEQQLLQGGKA